MGKGYEVCQFCGGVIPCPCSFSSPPNEDEDEKEQLSKGIQKENSVDLFALIISSILLALLVGGIMGAVVAKCVASISAGVITGAIAAIIVVIYWLSHGNDSSKGEHLDNNNNHPSGCQCYDCKPFEGWRG